MLKMPIMVLNVDGLENQRGKITHYCWLHVRLGKKNKLQRFFITFLGKDRMILGYPFLRVFNPSINWTEGRIAEGKVTLQSTCFKWICSLVAKAAKTYAKTGQLVEHTWAFLRKVNFAERWAYNTDRKQTYMSMQGLPAEFRCHWRVFSEELSRQFPPSRSTNMMIKFREGAPISINC
jgi:hypothetical protein